MSIPQSAGGPIESRDDLVRYLSDGCKPKSEWRIGTEHEKFVYDLKTHKPLPYEGVPGIRGLLEGMRRFGWEPILEGENIIGLTQNNASISLEPGGQFELSGAPLKSVHETCAEVNTHQQQVREVAAEIGAGALGCGFAPSWTMAETHQMPKGRYAIMRRYMSKVGGYGLEMMFRTCTVQVNLDFSSEVDMVKKFRVGLALQPVATALFANSPFRESKPNGFLSYRSHVWTDVDNDRAGMLPWVFDDGMSFERYVDYALDVPMYFVYRDGKYIDVAGRSFRDFLAHKIPELKGIEPQMSDWADHLTTIFPEARLKRFLEMRGADGGSWRRICGLPALWVGIFYDQTSLDAAWDLVKDWTAEERQAMRDAVPRLAFKTPFRKTTVWELAHRMIDISAEGLRRRASQDAGGMTEEGFLVPLREVINRGYTRAEELLQNYRKDWHGDLDRVFVEYNFL
ncbi:MAG: glutamate--cysteine ligase [Alphaproteobacteria bacterium]|nr:glutamate--cysteine ligase [Alphaproteobacteria bacterium]MDE2163162.1 glutamate--cysteine ligase [Alphaproteobacteria bacterium]MDE2264256.1 glutamate--cysteine ligase [Alphaproteobacteria bacterium]